MGSCTFLANDEPSERQFAERLEKTSLLNLFFDAGVGFGSGTLKALVSRLVWADSVVAGGLLQTNRKRKLQVVFYNLNYAIHKVLTLP